VRGARRGYDWKSGMLDDGALDEVNLHIFPICWFFLGKFVVRY
jgi:hypothetical protein